MFFFLILNGNFYLFIFSSFQRSKTVFYYFNVFVFFFLLVFSFSSKRFITMFSNTWDFFLNARVPICYSEHIRKVMIINKRAKTVFSSSIYGSLINIENGVNTRLIAHAERLNVQLIVVFLTPYLLL